MSRPQQTQILAALRALEFVNKDGALSEALLEYLQALPNVRRTILADRLRQLYPDAVRASEENATHGKLEELFAQYGLSGSTKRKAIAFFVHACEAAGIHVSSNFHRRPRRQRAARQPRRPSGAAPESPERGEEPRTSFRETYLQILLERVREGQSDPELLDRVERLLGLEGV